MHNSEILSTLFLAFEDLHRISENLDIVAAELDKRGVKEVRKNDRNLKSVAPMEYLESEALAWSAEMCEVMSCQIQAIHKRIESSIKL